MSDRNRLAFAVERSRTTKLGDVSTTWASFASCPASCPLKDGCYAKTGKCAMHAPTAPAAPVDVALTEASAIRELSGTRPLRLHVSGDASTPQCAGILGSAAREYASRHGQRAYTYTHAWAEVPRAAWGTGVCVSASMERLTDLGSAWSRGYRSFAVVVDGAHLPRRGFKLGPVDVVPCPHSITGVQCADCGLCMAEPKGGRGRAVLLPAHGARKSTVLRVLH